MILSGPEIEKRLNKDIIISPFNKEQLNPNSYNVTLCDKLYTYVLGEDGILDLHSKPEQREIIIPDEGFVIEPGTIYIGSTNEYTETYNLVPMITGRSSIGRVGLTTNIAACMGDVGFKNTWSLQLSSSAYRIRIYKNMPLAQLYYFQMCGEIKNYTGHYQNGSRNNKTSLIFDDIQKAKELIKTCGGQYDN